MMQRPISVTIFGILNIGFAVLGLILLLAGTIFHSHINETGHSALQQLLQNINADPRLAAWTRFITPFGALANIALLVSGIGLLFAQRWARLLAIVYGIYTIIVEMITAVITINANSSVLVLAFVILGFVVAAAYPVLLIIFMTRPKAVAACQPWQASAA